VGFDVGGFAVDENIRRNARRNSQGQLKLWRPKTRAAQGDSLFACCSVHWAARSRSRSTSRRRRRRKAALGTKFKLELQQGKELLAGLPNLLQ
jgi:hypothetical protein